MWKGVPRVAIKVIKLVRINFDIRANLAKVIPILVLIVVLVV
jgi:hypothetical protein